MKIVESKESKYERAAKRVKELKGFYDHIKIFILINGLLYLLKSGLLHSMLPEGFPTDPRFFDWIDANLFIWFLILAVHAMYTFRGKLKFLRNWEERQIQKYMEEEEEEINKFK